MLEIGKSAPAFCTVNKDNKKECLANYSGKWVVLYFYPKDSTPGCTTEALDFTRAAEDFKKMNAMIVGISADSPESHCKFADKHGLTITLLSDVTKEIVEKYGVWQKKKMAGREFMGIVRSTFLISPDKKIMHIWRNVKVAGHVREVMDKLQKLQIK